MSALVFVDTNVLLYAMDEADPTKHKVAQSWRRALWKNRTGKTSFQVLNEFYANVSKKWPDAQERARAEIRDLLAWQPVATGGEAIEFAWRVQDRYRLAYWDALIFAGAKAALCRYVLSEEFQPGQEIEGMRVINPFITPPDALA